MKPCHALHCFRKVADDVLMCQDHWSTLPHAMRLSVLLAASRRSWSPRDELAWHLAAGRARLCVAEREGQPYVAFLREVVEFRVAMLSGFREVVLCLSEARRT